MTTNKKVLEFIQQTQELCQPDKIVWVDGSEEQLEAFRKQAVDEKILIKLNQEKLPGCYLHRTTVNDVARVEGRTFICSKNKEDSAPINNWMETGEAMNLMNDLFKGVMKGRTMYVIPYSMGAVGSKFSKIGIELTDSIYVVLNKGERGRSGGNCPRILPIGAPDRRAGVQTHRPHCRLHRG